MKPPAGKWIAAVLVGALLIAGWIQFHPRRSLFRPGTDGIDASAAARANGQNTVVGTAPPATAAQSGEEKRQRVAEGNGVTVFAILERDGTFSIYIETHSGDISTYPIADKALLVSDKGPVKGD